MRRLAWVLGTFGLVTVLLLAAAGVAVAVVDPNDFKPQIIEAVRLATGRILSMNGPLRVSRSIWPTIEVTDVTLSNLPGGSRPDIARVGKITAELSLPSLLHREIEVVKLSLTGPNILFEQVGTAPNWVFDPPGIDAPAPTASPEPVPKPVTKPVTEPVPGSDPRLKLRIRAVDIVDGMVTWRFPARTKVIGIRSLEMHHPVDGGPLDATAVLVYGDNQPFKLQLTAQPTGPVREPWTTMIGLQAFDTTVSASGTMDVAGAYNLKVDAQSGALEALNALLPEMHLPPVHRATLSTRLQNGPTLGELPIVSAAKLHFATADLTQFVPGLTAGETDLSLDEAGGAATLTSQGQFGAQPFTLAGTVGVPQHPDGRVTLPLDLTAKATPARDKSASPVNGSLAVKGKVSLNALRFAGLDASVSLRTPALEALRPVLAAALPALTDVRFDGRVIIPADAGSVTVKGAKLAAHEGDIAGDWTLGTQKGLRMDGTLTSGQLDMDAMLDAFGVKLPDAPATDAPAGPVISTASLPWPLLRGPAIDLSAHVAAMTFQGQVWKDVRFQVALKDGRLQLSPVAVALPGGALQMSLTVDASQDTAPLSVEMHAPGIPLALIGRYARLPGPMAGAVKVDVQLRGAGHSPHEIAASLNGPISATMTGGSMSNAAFTILTSASLEALGIHVPPQGDTALHCMGIIGAFANGVGKFPTIALDTTYLQLDGKGEVDFANETTALKLHPLAQISGSSVAVPVVIEGPFHAVKGRLDADGLDKLGLFLDGVFGGDQSTVCADAGLAPRKQE